MRLDESTEAGSDITLNVDVQNTGSLDGDEVVQVYVQNPNADEFNPHKTLAAFERTTFEPGETKTLTFKISKEQLSTINTNGDKEINPGKYTISVGGAQPSKKRIQKGTVVQKNITVTGSNFKL